MSWRIRYIITCTFAYNYTRWDEVLVMYNYYTCTVWIYLSSTEQSQGPTLCGAGSVKALYYTCTCMYEMMRWLYTIYTCMYMYVWKDEMALYYIYMYVHVCVWEDEMALYYIYMYVHVCMKWWDGSILYIHVCTCMCMRWWDGSPFVCSESKWPRQKPKPHS